MYGCSIPYKTNSYVNITLYIHKGIKSKPSICFLLKQRLCSGVFPLYFVSQKCTMMKRLYIYIRRINLLFYLFFHRCPIQNLCFFPVGLSLLMQHFQQVLWVLKFLLSPGLGSLLLEFKSLIIVIVSQ